MKHNISEIKRMLLTMAVFFLTATVAWAQNTVTGIVKDEFGEGIIGANVIVKGTTQGSTTDMDGKFSIADVKKNDVLTISFIGYITQEVVFTGQKIDVTLVEDKQSLEEVMVVGYAVGSKRTISGAVDRIKKEDMNQGVVISPADALKGKSAGVVIAQSGGDPMGSTSINIRGTSSLSGGSDPLVIVDGVFGDMTMFNALSPNDIETMTILKDASETAQYGSRGAAGVIVITTVKGKAGSSHIDYQGQFGINHVYKNLDLMSASDWRTYAKQSGAGFTDLGANTNWFEAIENSTSITQNHSIAWSSGTDEHNMRASLSMAQKEGIIKNSDMTNYTAKIDAQQYGFDRKLKLELGLSASQRNGKQMYSSHDLFYAAGQYNPTYPTVRNADGVYDEDYAASEIYNPLGQLSIDNNYEVAHINAHGKLTWNIVKDLSLSAFGSYTYVGIQHKQYIPNDIVQGSRNGNGMAWIGNTVRRDMMGNVQLTYTKEIGRHHIDALALVEGQKYNTFYNSTKSTGFETNYFGYNNMQAGSTVAWGYATSNSTENILMSYMARLNYMFNDRYIATVNFRTDGSSKLGSENKWGIFPSASLAWIISNEEWMKQISWINNMKLRAGYGLTGNQDAINAYNSLELMKPNGVTQVNGVSTTTFALTSNANPDLKWEVKKTFDVGFDVAMLHNRLNVTLDWYRSTTSDMLYTYSVPVPPFTYNTLLANIGEMTNNGFEIAVNGDIIKTKDLTLSAGFNLSFQQNKLKSLHGTYKGQELTTSKHIGISSVNGQGQTQDNNVVYLMEDQPVGVFYLYHCNGITSEGIYDIADLNNDGTISKGDDSEDRQVCGQATPKAFLGANIGLKYKGWDLTMQFNGAFGHKIFNNTSLTYYNTANFPTYNVFSDAFSKNNGKGIKDSQISDYWLEDGDYVNLEYISVGYNWNKAKLNCKYIQNIRVALSCNNVATITGYSGMTPMINSTSYSNGYLGVDDKQIYPLNRTFSLSLGVTF